MLLWARVGGREAEASINDALAGVARCGICFFARKQNRRNKHRKRDKNAKVKPRIFVMFGSVFLFQNN